jgi:hypothetical protein
LAGLLIEKHAIEIRTVIVGAELRRARKIGDRLLGIALRVVKVCSAEIGAGVVALQRDGPISLGDRGI